MCVPWCIGAAAWGRAEGFAKGNRGLMPQGQLALTSDSQSGGQSKVPGSEGLGAISEEL